MRTIYCALIADELFTSLTIIDKWIFMVDTVSRYGRYYAEGGGVGLMEETSDWFSSFLILDVVFLALDYLAGALEGDLEGVFSFYLLLDLDLSDFCDLLSYVFFFLLLELAGIFK